MRLFSPLGWLFAIRAETTTAARAILWATFLAGVFGLWMFATDSPQWWKRLIVAAFPQYELRQGDAIELRLDRAHGQLEIVKPVSGRTILRDLPPLATAALPELTPANYEGLFRRLEDDGLGGFEPAGEGSFTGRVRDAERARIRLRDLGPLPYQLPVIEPLAAGEPVSLRLDRPAETAGPAFVLSLGRTGKTMTIPFAVSQLAPAAIPPLTAAAYPGLPTTLAASGVGGVTDASGEPRWEVVDLERARAAGLGLDRPAELRRLTRSALPSPTELIDSLPVLWSERNLPEATWLTLSRILQGFAWAVLVALPLGLFMGAFTRIGILFDPLRLTGMYIPLPALIPLTIAWVGIGEPQIVLFLAICIAVVLLPFAVASVQAVPAVYLDTARTLGASRGQIFRYVLLAVSWPTLFRGLKLGFAVGWTWIMLAEVIGVSNGLGYIINTSQRRGYIEHVYLVIALVIGMAFLSNALWNLLSRLLFPYREGED